MSEGAVGELKREQLNLLVQHFNETVEFESMHAPSFLKHLG